MKVLLINGSPHAEGCTARALREVAKTLEQEGIQTEIIHVGNKDIRGCIACGACRKIGKCAFNDIVNEVSEKMNGADGLIVGTPVYYASANATVTALMDRLFYSSSSSFRWKVGAVICSARRGGTTATFDQLNKYFTISGMPIVSGQYWNAVHGKKAEDVELDEEGLQQMRTLAHNAAFMIKSIALGKKKYGYPEKEEQIMTNFIK